MYFPREQRDLTNFVLYYAYYVKSIGHIGRVLIPLSYKLQIMIILVGEKPGEK